MTMGCPSGGKTQSAAEREREALKTKVERVNLGKADRSYVQNLAICLTRVTPDCKDSYWNDWILRAKFCRATANVITATLMEFSLMYHLTIDFGSVLRTSLNTSEMM